MCPIARLGVGLLLATAAAPAAPYYPVVADKALDCAVRSAAWNFSRTIQPERGSQLAVFDALQLEAYCGELRPHTGLDAAPRPRTSPFATAGRPAFYCDAASGDDGSPGTLQQPFLTVHRGRDACRSAAAPACTVYLRAGAPFVLTATLELTAADSGLTLSAYSGDANAPVLTGAAPLTGAPWQPYNVSGANIWVTRALRLPSTPGALFVGGERMVRARWPNCNPETCLVPDGYSNATTWLPPVPPVGAPTVIHGNFSRAFDVYFPDYTWATGGAAVGRFEPPEGYWIAPSPPGGTTFATPAGFTYDPARFSPRAASWTNATTGIVHVFHGEYWGNWMFPVASLDAAAGRLLFGPGGWQEARGWPTGGALFVENVLQELDSSGEWFYDESTGDLYLWANGTAPGTPPPTDDSITLAAVEQLITLTGTAGAPVVGATLSGLRLTGSQPTFLARPFRAPSGGDWSFADTAAVVATGTADLAVHACTFDHLGGNGLLLRGWNRAAQVTQSTFTRLGDSGIVSAGYAAGQDLSALNVPVGTLVDGCLFCDLGQVVKQAGALYSALSANTTFSSNVAFNLPRAAVNVNDGAFGGHLIARNLVTGAVRETADHGAVNTWDRSPFVQPGRVNPDGSPALLPSPIRLTGNFLHNGYYSIHPADHDDGSNTVVDTGNVFAFAGTKNYEGFNKSSVSNLVVRPDFAAPGGAGRSSAGEARQARRSPSLPKECPSPSATTFLPVHAPWDRRRGGQPSRTSLRTTRASWARPRRPTCSGSARPRRPAATAAFRSHPATPSSARTELTRSPAVARPWTCHRRRRRAMTLAARRWRRRSRPRT
jgi:hypothetical protein